MSIPNAFWHILSAEWKSKELLPCQLPLVANKDNELRWVFPSWYFDLDWNWAGHYTSVSPIATSTINPTDRCDNFLIFLHVGTGRREPNVSLHHLFRRHFAGGGRRKKIPQKSFSASKVQIPLQRLSSSTLQHAANLQLCRIMFNLQIKTTLLQHALRVKAPHILGRSETRWHFLFYICNTPIRIMKFGIGGLGPNQIFLFLDAVTSPAPSPMCI